MITLALIGLLAVLISIVVLGAPHVERSLLYRPSGGRVSPRAIGLAQTSEVVMTAPDGEQIIAWSTPAAQDKPTILYVHGNGASLAARCERLHALTSRGFGVFIMSYRGYSGSTGTPSERANIADATRAFDELTRSGIAAHDIVVYGESLGTGVAIQVAAKRPVAGVILDAPYTSIVDVARRCYPLLPAAILMRDRYESLRHVKSISVPVLIIHGEQDDVIPVEMGHTLAAAIKSDVTIKTFPLAGHTDHDDHGSMDAVATWLNEGAAGCAPEKKTDAA